MPIIFRCEHCNQLMSVSRRQAGASVPCPGCADAARVPTLEEAAARGQLLRTGEKEHSPSSLLPDSHLEDDSDVSGHEATAEESEKPAGVGAEDLLVADEDSAPPDEVDRMHREPGQTTFARQPASVEEEDELFEFRHRGRAESGEGLDLTPMVDVTFLLLIFFMITASMTLQKSLPTTPPDPDQEGVAPQPMIEQLQDQSVIVEITAQDEIFVDDQPVGTRGELVEVLVRKRAQEQKPDMLIEAAREAPIGTVVMATDAGLEAGMQQIRQVTPPPQ